MTATILRPSYVLASSADCFPVRTGYVYALVDAAEPERVRYIGSTWQPATRMVAHVYRSGGRLGTWEFAVRKRGGVVLMRELARDTDRARLYEMEAEQIALYRLEGMADLNGPHTHPGYSFVPGSAEVQCL